MVKALGTLPPGTVVPDVASAPATPGDAPTGKITRRTGAKATKAVKGKRTAGPGKRMGRPPGSGAAKAPKAARGGRKATTSVVGQLLADNGFPVDATKVTFQHKRQTLVLPLKVVLGG